MSDPSPPGRTGRWRLELLWALPHPLPDARLEELAAAVSATAGWFLARSLAGVSVSVWVTTDRPERALGELLGLVRGWLVRELPDARLGSLQACSSAEVAAELRRPMLPALASVPDAAQLLGVSRERVQLLRSADHAFPAPVIRVATGPLWTVEALRAYRRRRPRD